MILLSVIVPTRNRERALKDTLTSFIAQTYPSDNYEIIVVDNGSIDNTQNVCQALKSKLPNLLYFFDARPGLHVGRHLGMKMSKGDILVFADDDIEAFPTRLEGIAEAFKDSNVVLVGGKNLPKFETEPPDWIKQMWKEDRERNKVIGYLSILDLGNEIKEINPMYVYGCNYSIRKLALLEAGGFHPDGMPEELIRYRGDGESHISRYISDRKYKTLYHPKASVYHLVPKIRITEDYFCKRAFNQGISDSYTNIRNGNIKHDWKIPLRKVKHFLGLVFGNKRAVKIQAAYYKGYGYHQRLVKTDFALYEWVRKANYLEETKFI